jgi:hypothetical protein
MPSYTRGIERNILTFVKVSTQNAYYGWKTKDLANISGVSTSDVAALGHLLPSSLPAGALGFLAANAPKPPRAYKKLTNTPSPSVQQGCSTYCGIDSLATAQAAGWDIVSGGRGVSIRNSTSITLGARLSNGLIYVFSKNAADATAIATELGLILPANMSAAERGRAFRGASKPRPAKVSKPSGARGRIHSFCSDDKLDDALAVGWTIDKPAIPYTAAAAASPP